MKYKFTLIALLYTILSFAQIGIGVENPTEILEVEG